jgi:hypothetical protein
MKLSYCKFANKCLFTGTARIGTWHSLLSSNLLRSEQTNKYRSIADHLSSSESDDELFDSSYYFPDLKKQTIWTIRQQLFSLDYTGFSLDEEKRDHIEQVILNHIVILFEKTKDNTLEVLTQTKYGIVEASGIWKQVIPWLCHPKIGTQIHTLALNHLKMYPDSFQQGFVRYYEQYGEFIKIKNADVYTQAFNNVGLNVLADIVLQYCGLKKGIPVSKKQVQELVELVLKTHSYEPFYELLVVKKEGGK